MQRTGQAEDRIEDLVDGFAVGPDDPDIYVQEAALGHLEHQTHLRARFHLNNGFVKV